MTAFDRLGTEARDAAGTDLDLRPTVELVELAGDRKVFGFQGKVMGKLA